MSSTPLSLAFIGAGGITHAHRVALDQHPETFRLAGVADPHLPAAEALATAYGAKAFTSPETMLDALPEIQGAVITSPHFLHYSQARMVLERGLCALVEKPVVCNLEELRALQILEKERGGFIQAGQMQRFGSEENWLRSWLNSPAFGEPRLFNLDIYQNVHGYITGKSDPWILDKARAGGGIVISVGIHILDLLRFWFDDDYVEVTASGRFDPPMSNGAESTCVAVLKTRRGMLGTLNCSYTVARTPYSQRSLLFGSHGTLAQHMDPVGGGCAGPYYISSDGGKPSPEWDMMYAGFQKVAHLRAAEAGAEAAPSGNAFVSQLLHFAERVRQRQAGENSLARNLNTIALMDAIARSIQSGRTETIETV